MLLISPKMASLLNVIRKYNQIDCDTLDVEGISRPTTINTRNKGANALLVAEEFGPFVDCTSNQVRDLTLLSIKLILIIP